MVWTARMCTSCASACLTALARTSATAKYTADSTGAGARPSRSMSSAAGIGVSSASASIASPRPRSTADPPAQHAEPVDHCRVRIGPHEGVAEGAPVLGREHHPRTGTRGSPGGRCPCPGVPAGSHERRPGPNATTVALMFREYSRRRCVVGRTVARTRPRCTEWSITSSTGTSGLTRARRRPGAPRVTHRGQVKTPGTPVKSCISTRSGVNAISWAEAPAPWP